MKYDQKIINKALNMIRENSKSSSEVFSMAGHSKDFFKLRIGNLEHEEFHVLFLNNRHGFIADEMMARGTIDSASVYPREVVKAALKHNAAAVIFGHNHPSGEVIPSQADKNITDRLKKALGLIDIRVLDHIIVSGDNSMSFTSEGLL